MRLVDMSVDIVKMFKMLSAMGFTMGTFMRPYQFCRREALQA